MVFLARAFYKRSKMSSITLTMSNIGSVLEELEILFAVDGAVLNSFLAHQKL